MSVSGLMSSTSVAKDTMVFGYLPGRRSTLTIYEHESKRVSVRTEVASSTFERRTEYAVMQLLVVRCHERI